MHLYYLKNTVGPQEIKSFRLRDVIARQRDEWVGHHRMTDQLRPLGFDVDGFLRIFVERNREDGKVKASVEFSNLPRQLDLKKTTNFSQGCF